MIMSKMKLFLMTALASLSLAVTAQDVDEDNAPVEWYLDEVVRGTFVQEYGFDYYYTPSVSDMKQQRAKGEVTYFLNTPTGLNSKKACALIDRIMADCDGVRKMNDWQSTATTCWKEFSMQRNKIRFSVKTKALDDGSYYVSVTETANAYKNVPKSNQEKKPDQGKASSTKRGARSDRKPVVVNDEPQPDGDDALEFDTVTDNQEEIEDEGEQQQLTKREREAAKRLEQEKQREQARAEKEAEKLRKAQEKKAKQEREALKKEQEKLKKEQEKQLREEERQRQAAERQQQALARQEQKKERQRQAEYAASKYHYTDVALWLSDKYDFTQTTAGDNTLTMYSTAIKDVEETKLVIKNALKGSNARMAIPWRINSQNGTVETGYSVDGHVLVFAIGNNDAGNITLSITEMDNSEFESYKKGDVQ